MKLNSQVMVLLSAATVRGTPIAIGFLVALLFGPKAYADTVLAITAANLCGALPSVALGPLVLRAETTHVANALAFRGLLLGIPVVIASAWLVSERLAPGLDHTFVALYSGSIFIFGISQALRNQKLENARAFFHGIAITFAGFLGALIGYLFALSLEAILDILAAMLLVSGLTSFGSLYIRKVGEESRSLAPMSSAPALLNSILSGIFSLLVMIGIFITNLRARESGDLSGYVAFSLGLQGFSIVLFIPGALSAHFVPRLVKSGLEKIGDGMRRAFRSYMLVGTIAFTGTMVAAPICFTYLEVPHEVRLYLIFSGIQLAALIAAANAAFNQILVVLGRFNTLALLSLIWLVVLLVVQQVNTQNVLWLSGALFVSYLVLLGASKGFCQREIHGGRS